MDTWLVVVLTTWLFEIMLAALLNGGLYDVGFYVGRVYGMIASSTVLYMLLRDYTRLHADFARLSLQSIADSEYSAAQRVIEAVVTQLPVGVLVMRDVQTHLLVNDRAATILRLDRDMAESGIGFLKSDVLATDMQPIRDFISTIETQREFVETEVKLSVAGETRTIVLSGRPVLDKANSTLGFVIVMNDVTEKREAERMLDASLTRLRSVIENTPLAVIEWNASGVVTRWNARAESLFGWPKEEIIGGQLCSLPIMHEDERLRVDELSKLVREPVSRYLHTALRHRTKLGAIKDVEWYTSVLLDQSGAVDTAFSLILDVSERTDAFRQLQEADRRKDMQLVTIAHELRNPLSPIAQVAILMQNNSLPDDRVQWAADLINRQTKHMATLLDDLLDVTRIASGKIRLDQRITDLVMVLNDALEMSQPLMNRNNHALTVTLPATPVLVFGDGMRLTQVFANLLTNAGKYTEPGGDIELRLEVNTDEVVVVIADNGIGIDPAMILRIFEPFVQVDRASHLSRGGLGVGLALAKAIVELHQGTLVALSGGSSKGSTFKVSLPQVSEDSGCDDEMTTLRRRAFNKAILVADDNTDSADSLAVILRAAGARVDVAYNGGVALEFMTNRTFDVAILDIAMPILSGRQVAQRMAQRSGKPYLIALTSLDRDVDRELNLKSGFDLHYTKPISPDDLFSTLEKIFVA